MSRFNCQIPNCSELIRQSVDLLRAENLSYSCSALEETDCDLTYQRIYARSSPENVYSRSRRCELDWPEYGEISSEERDFPLAYFLTVYTDARILELSLATIFRPHNSYCLHIDRKAGEMFKRTILQLINCYRAKVSIAWICALEQRFVQFPGSYISKSSKNTEVYWGHSSVLEAELLCLKDLLHNNKSWHYAIDMAGSEVEDQLSCQTV